MFAAVALLVATFAGAGTDAASAGRGHITILDGFYGQTSTATVNPGGEDAWAHAECYQDGKLVYAQYVKVAADNTATFTLGPTPSWTGGDADCIAEELSYRNGRFRAIASTTFHVFGQ